MLLANSVPDYPQCGIVFAEEAIKLDSVRRDDGTGGDALQQHGAAGDAVERIGVDQAGTLEVHDELVDCLKGLVVDAHAGT